MNSENKDRVLEAKQYRQLILDKLSIETSNPETLFPEEENESLFVDKMDAKIKALKSIMDDMVLSGRNFEKKMRDDFDTKIDQLNKRYHNAKTALSEIRDSKDKSG